MAIKPRVFVTVRKSRRPQRAKSPYIDGCFDAMGVIGSVYINSQIPSSSGLGSSAAVTVATLSAINDEFSVGKSREDIANMAFEIEKTVQKGRASPTDTTVSTYGGIVLISGGSRRRLAPQNMYLVIGDSLVSHSTSRMVEQVADLKKQNPEIVDPILDAIEGVSLAAIHHLSNPRELGRVHEHKPCTAGCAWCRAPAVLTSCAQLPVRPGRSAPRLPGPVAGAAWWLSAQSRSGTGFAQAIQSCDARAIVTGIDTEGVRKEKNV